MLCSVHVLDKYVLYWISYGGTYVAWIETTEKDE